MIMQCRLLAAAGVAILASGAQAADLGYKAPPPAPMLARGPAVDGVNGKFEGFGGWSDWRNHWARRGNFSGGFLASVTAPLGSSFGVQVDTLTASHRGSFVGGGGGHVFWRDPEVGLIGAYGAVVRNNWMNDTRFRVGGEGAYYFGRFSATAVVGYEEGSSTTVANPFFVTPNIVGFNFLPNRGRVFDMVDFNFYATQNIKFSVGHRYIGGRHAASIGGESLIWNLGEAMLSGFVEGRVGESDYKAAWAGLRLYFGQSDKTLMARHRQDDPPNWLKDDMFAAQNAHRVGALVSAPAAAPPIEEPPPVD